MLGNHDEARETVADVLAQVLAKPPTRVRNAEAFLVTMAKRRAIDQLRATRSDRRRLLTIGGGSILPEADVADLVAYRQEAV